MLDESDVVVVGAGFAGVWAGAAAVAARNDAGAGGRDLRVAVVNPGDDLVIRPRLYQGDPHRMRIPLDAVLGDLGIRRINATVTGIEPDARRITLATSGGGRASLAYRRLVLASGSQLAVPDLVGASHLFDVDTLTAASRLDVHLARLHARPATPGRDTVVVVGAGFAGIELATEMGARLRESAAPGGRPRVVLVEARDVIGPDLGPGPRPVIAAALAELGVEVRLGRRLTEVTDRAATFADGSSIESATVVWTGGMVASPLTAQVPGPRDGLGRLVVDEFLRVAGNSSIFAAGDTAAAVGPDGRTTLQSCQHAIPLGKFAGHNAAADLLGRPPKRFDPGPYITCLDLGAAGAVVTTGWDRQVRLTGEPAKAIKKAIVESYIYPPADDPDAVLAIARVGEHPPLPL